ncbi:MAG: hypothetical protein R2932_10995 [Caldilineaceae bacterium]
MAPGNVYPITAVCKQLVATLHSNPSRLTVRPPLTNSTAVQTDELLRKVAKLPYLQ